MFNFLTPDEMESSAFNDLHSVFDASALNLWYFFAPKKMIVHWK